MVPNLNLYDFPAGSFVSTCPARHTATERARPTEIINDTMANHPLRVGAPFRPITRSPGVGHSKLFSISRLRESDYTPAVAVLKTHRTGSLAHSSFPK